MLPCQSAPGFVSCRLLFDANDQNVLVYNEAWKTTEDLDRQIRSMRFTRLLSLMEDADQPPELKLSWVTDVKGLEYLESVRRQVI